MKLAIAPVSPLMDSPRSVDELFDSPERLVERDPRRLLRAVASAGAQVRETARLVEEAQISGLADSGRPRALVVVGRREGAIAGAALRALAGPECPVWVVHVPGPDIPVWVTAADLVLVLSRTGAGAYALAAADDAARRGCAMVGVGAADAPLHARCAQARAPYVALPGSREQQASLWSLMTPTLLVAGVTGVLPGAIWEPETVADLLDESALRCGPIQESFANPAKALALEVLDSQPILVSQGAVAAVVAERAVDQLSVLAGLPVAHFQLPEQAVPARRILSGPLRAVTDDDFFRDRTESTQRELRMVCITDSSTGDAADAMRALRDLADRTHVVTSVLQPISQQAAEQPIREMAELIGMIDFAAAYVSLATDMEASR